MKKIILLCVMACVSTSSLAEEFRIWKDRNGNTIEAELCSRMGTDIIILRDRKGKTHRIDVSKLSDEDQLYLNPPPPRYELNFTRSVSRTLKDDGDGIAVSTNTYVFGLQVQFLVADASSDELTGALLAVGKDESGNYVVMDKIEAPVEVEDAKKGELAGSECVFALEKDENQKIIKGVQYYGFVVVLYGKGGVVLARDFSNKFLADQEKAFALEVGDRFNKKLEKIDAGT